MKGNSEAYRRTQKASQLIRTTQAEDFRFNSRFRIPVSSQRNGPVRLLIGAQPIPGMKEFALRIRTNTMPTGKRPFQRTIPPTFEPQCVTPDDDCFWRFRDDSALGFEGRK